MLLPPILFCLYVNDLFTLIRRNRAGYMIDDYYAGGSGYADDLLLLCPSRDGLQKMVESTDNYAVSTNVDPVKSKTKGIMFRDTELYNLPVPVILDGNHLPLGNKITSVQDGYHQDAREKRAR